MTALRRLRDADDDLPVVMLAARAGGVDRIVALNGEPMITSPSRSCPGTHSPHRSRVRRRNAMPAGTPVEGGECVSFGENQLDLSARTLLQNNQPVVITSGEFSLLTAFVQHPHRPLSERLIELARGPGSATDSRSMDVQVSRVRKLVEPDQPAPVRANGLGVWICLRTGWHAEIPLKCLANGGSRGNGALWGLGNHPFGQLDAGSPGAAGAVRPSTGTIPNAAAGRLARRAAHRIDLELSPRTDRRAHRPGTPGEPAPLGSTTRNAGDGPAAGTAAGALLTPHTMPEVELPQQSRHAGLD